MINEPVTKGPTIKRFNPFLKIDEKNFDQNKNYNIYSKLEEVNKISEVLFGKNNVQGNKQKHSN